VTFLYRNLHLLIDIGDVGNRARALGKRHLDAIDQVMNDTDVQKHWKRSSLRREG
jgi:hypothetical protein